MSNLHIHSAGGLVAVQTGTSQVLIGDPKEAKFGTTTEQLLEGYRRCKELGVKRFGLHAMVVSNCCQAAHQPQVMAMASPMVEFMWRKLETLNN